MDLSPKTTQKAYNKARKAEGDLFERDIVPPWFASHGLAGSMAHQSEGPFDYSGWLLPQGYLVVAGARLTKLNLDVPQFDNSERNDLWDIACRSQPGFVIVPLVVAVKHAAPVESNLCYCSGEPTGTPELHLIIGRSGFREPAAWRRFDINELHGAPPAVPGPHLEHLLDLYADDRAAR